MIKNQTVFVIGAGASKEAKLPIGPELTTEIGSLLAPVPTRHGSYDFGREINGFLSGDPIRKGAREAAKMIRDAMPLAPSIDNFLHTHRGDNNVVRLGKMAIAAAILKAERNSLLFRDVENIHNTPNFGALSRTWYVKLWHILCTEVNAEEVERIFENVSFVVFNYDRCLEQFFYYALKTYYRVDDDKAAEIMKGLRIYHPYGKVGSLSYTRADRGNHFGQTELLNNQSQIPQEIRTFTERVEEADMLSSIHTEIAAANKLIFLGFHYHQINMKLLASGKRSQVRRIFGTRYGMSDSDSEVVKGRIVSMLMEDGPGSDGRAPDRNHVLSETLSVHLLNGTCSELFSEYSQSIGT